METRYWLVICPLLHFGGNPREVWDRWLGQGCVAVGWPPFEYPDDGPTEPGWTRARNALRLMKPGHRVIPYLMNWRIGPAATIREVRWSANQWYPTVEPEDGYELNPGRYELGRRILVNWEIDGMPPPGYAARIPEDSRRGRPDARASIEELAHQRFDELVLVLRNPCNWVAL
jgi:hypothetical protein